MFALAIAFQFILFAIEADLLPRANNLASVDS